MDKRNVIISNGNSHDAMLFLTDTPKEDIEKWCKEHNNIVKSYFSMRRILYNALVLLIDETYGQYEDPDEWYNMVFNELDCAEEKLKKIGISISKDGDITMN